MYCKHASEFNSHFSSLRSRHFVLSVNRTQDYNTEHHHPFRNAIDPLHDFFCNGFYFERLSVRLKPVFEPRTFNNHETLLVSALWIAFIVLVTFLASSEARAQDADAKAPPAPVDVSVRTKDGVELNGTYYPSNRGKEAVPVILMHGYKETRNKFDRLAKFLQAEHGHAVLAVDFRGHGSSTQQAQTRRGHGESRRGQIPSARFYEDDRE